MRRALRSLLFALALALPGVAHAAGTIPLALTQPLDSNSQLLTGCLLYFYVAGTVATPQNSYQDFGLTQANPNPLPCDATTARIPMFWLADGLIHARLTDSVGGVVIDTTMQVLGPSGGGGGGGGGFDPTAVASTGDVKFRLTSETISGWVKLNATTIGSATSGATQRANSDTQALFILLWNTCPDAHCPVPGGRGANGLADFNANKQITVPDMRDSAPLGRDCMENLCLGGLLSSNITSGGGDGVDTPGAFGGDANTTLTRGNLPNVAFSGSVNIPAGQGNHTHTTPSAIAAAISGGGFFAGGGSSGPAMSIIAATLPGMTGTASVNSGGAGTPFANLGPFKLGSFYQKL